MPCMPSASAASRFAVSAAFVTISSAADGALVTAAAVDEDTVATTLVGGVAIGDDAVSVAVVTSFCTHRRGKSPSVPV